GDVLGIGETPRCNSLQPETCALYSQPMGAYCSRCGTQNSADSQFCIHCGGALGPLPVAQQFVTVTSTRYAGFWMRFVAAIIDAILIQVVVFPVSMVVGMIIGVAGVATHSTGPGLQVFSGGIGGMIGIAAAWLY